MFSYEVVANHRFAPRCWPVWLLLMFADLASPLCETPSVACPSSTGYCLNGGTCCSLHGTKYCKCPGNFIGARCKKFDEHGVGYDLGETGAESIRDLADPLCDTPFVPCPSSTGYCLNGATCCSFEDLWFCKCEKNWFGRRCQESSFPGGLTLDEGVYIDQTVGETGKLSVVDLVEVNPELGNSVDQKKTIESAKKVISGRGTGVVGRRRLSGA